VRGGLGQSELAGHAVEAREDQAEVVCKIVEQEMVKAGERIVTLVPVVADAKIADYWSK